MISFYPGPSRVHDEIPKYVKDAARLGIMSINHRSEEFVAISKKTITLLKQKLGIPKDFTIFFTSSATECWEIIAQSWVTDKSYHVYNGAFGQKWFDYTHRIKPGATALPFDKETKLDPATLNFEGSQGVICLTHNETSNGTQVDPRIIKAIKKNNPSHLVAVDATSSMAGVMLDFTAADVWFASVQKCFGLPAGMGILICAPSAIARAKAVNNTQYYNSVVFMDVMMQKWQTPYTPNVLAIYLLMRVMEKVKPIKQVHATTVKRYQDWLGWLQKNKAFQHLIKNKAVHSFTVLPLEGDPSRIEKIKQLAKKQHFLLGEGYGEWKASTFRIANFPTLKASEIASLRGFLARQK